VLLKDGGCSLRADVLPSSRAKRSNLTQGKLREGEESQDAQDRLREAISNLCACFSPYDFSLVCFLPGKVEVFPSKMPVGGSLAVDGATQIQGLDDSCWP
jgi:hypothetical protein